MLVLLHHPKTQRMQMRNLHLSIGRFNCVDKADSHLTIVAKVQISLSN